MSNAPPSINPANNDTLSGMLNQVLDKFIQGVAGVLPASVVSYSPGQPDVVRVQPLIDLLNTDGKTFSRGQIAQVPVCQIGAGGYFLHFNLKPGDTGLIIACDRDISGFIKTGKASPPGSLRKKDFGDSFFLPVVLRGYTIAPEDIENAVLQNLDGSVRISLFSDKVKITGGLEVDTLTVTGDTNIQGKTIIIGDLNTGADITAAGSITPGVPLPP